MDAVLVPWHPTPSLLLLYLMPSWGSCFRCLTLRGEPFLGIPMCVGPGSWQRVVFTYFALRREGHLADGDVSPVPFICFGVPTSCAYHGTLWS